MTHLPRMDRVSVKMALHSSLKLLSILELSNGRPVGSGIVSHVFSSSTVFYYSTHSLWRFTSLDTKPGYRFTVAA